MSSSNPFRRKINAEAAQSSVPTNATAAAQPLSINTASRPGKHVRIASPPDTAISPASYPSSPEYARLSPSPQLTVVPETFKAGPQTKLGDPFGAADDSGHDEDAEVVSEALKYTRLNYSTSRPPPAQGSGTSDNAVQNTLSKFASRPRDGISQIVDTAPAAPRQDAKRHTMDVDAFTRLLLTGGGSPQGSSGASSSITTAVPTNTLSESSSTADSASVSRQSIFEPMPPIVAESPRTSHELDENDSTAVRKAATAGGASEAIKKPPPAPRPRHGRLIEPPQPSPAASESLSTPTAGPVYPGPRSPGSDTNKPLPFPPLSDSSRRSSATSVVGVDPSLQIKRPPTPPLARRRSQGPNKPTISKNSPSLQPLTSTSQPLSSSSSLPQISKAPPPPPSRRTSQRLSETATPLSLPPTSEETGPSTEEGPPDLSKPIIPRNTLTRTTSTATRASVLSAENVPPPPPPRRHRGSSNASLRPALSMTASPIPAGSSDLHPAALESTRKTSEGASRDILKDLASLQAEVDALRKLGLRE